MHSIPPANLLCPTRIPSPASDIPLPHRPGCGDAPPLQRSIDVVAERLRSALETAEALRLDVIDLHLCELRQLARWHIVARPDDVPRYFQHWTIDDADPVFPVPVDDLREMLAKLQSLPPVHHRPPRSPSQVLSRAFV